MIAAFATFSANTAPHLRHQRRSPLHACSSAPPANPRCVQLPSNLTITSMHIGRIGIDVVARVCSALTLQLPAARRGSRRRGPRRPLVDRRRPHHRAPRRLLVHEHGPMRSERADGRVLLDPLWSGVAGQLQPPPDNDSRPDPLPTSPLPCTMRASPKSIADTSPDPYPPPPRHRPTVLAADASG